MQGRGYLGKWGKSQLREELKQKPTLGCGELDQTKGRKGTEKKCVCMCVGWGTADSIPVDICNNLVQT
jgi:hypothetical protein